MTATVTGMRDMTTAFFMIITSGSSTFLFKQVWIQGSTLAKAALQLRCLRHTDEPRREKLYKKNGAKYYGKWKKMELKEK